MKNHDFIDKTWAETKNSFFLGITILIIIVIVKPQHLLITWLCVITPILTYYLFNNIKNNEKIKPKSWLITTIYSAGFVTAFYIMAKILGNGFLGLIIPILLIVAYKLYKRRKLYLEGMRNIETMIWGKPLDKKLWREEHEQRSNGKNKKPQL